MTETSAFKQATPKSRSHKVNGYVKAHRRWARLLKDVERAHAEMIQRRAALTGSQLAEANRLLREAP